MTVKEPGDELLDPVAAAIRLGVTPELLFHYASRNTRTTLRTFRLASRTVGGRTLFSEPDLDAFDERLSEPRSEPGARRVDCEAAVTAHLRVEAGGGCARCGRGVAVENAHIEPYSSSRSNHHRNVVRLCAVCHAEYDRGLLTREEVTTLKHVLVQRVCDRLAAGHSTTLRELPPRARLHGRARDLSQLVAALRSVRSVVVRGVGGIGKTQLVLHGANAANTGRPLVWVPLEECGSEALLQAYVAAAAAKVGDGDPVSVLSGVRACVVLDGVERGGCGLAAVADLVERLTADGQDIQVVVTTQARLPEIAFDADLPLAALDRTASAELLPGDVDQIDREDLLDIGDGHPLTLRILAALVRHLGDASAAVDLLKARRNHPIEVPGRAAQGPRTSLDLCLSVALEALSDREQTSLWVLAQLPAGLATGLINPRNLGMDDAVTTLATLRRWHLIEDQPLWEERLITMLSPVRDFVRRAVETSPPAGLGEVRVGVALCIAGMVAHLNERLIHGGEVRLGMRLLDRELPNALSILDLARAGSGAEPRLRSLVTWLAFSLQTYFFTSGAFQAGLDVMRVAADLATAAGEPFEALELLSQLQSLAGRANRPDLAEAALRDARKLAIGDDPRSRGVLLSMEAHVLHADESYWARDDTATNAALEAARRSFDLLVEASDGKITHRAALSLLQQACLLSDARRPVEALPLLDQAIAHLRTAEDPINTGAALQRRGNCMADLRRPEEAMRSYAESAVLFHELEAMEYRSNALGEAGLVLAEHPEASCPPEIGPEIIVGGIDDTVDRVVLALPSVAVPGNDWSHNLTRKICGMIVLASLSANADCLSHMAQRLRLDVAEALMAREPEQSRQSGGSIVTRHFGALAWLCEHLAELPEEQGCITVIEVESLAVLVEVVFRGDLLDQMFGWLARYLSERHGLVGLRPGELRAAVDAIGFGRAFALDRFDLA